MSFRFAVLIGLLLTVTALPAVTANAATTGVVVVAAGDIACGPAAPTVTPTTCQQAATAKVTTSLAPRFVLPLGDLVYQAGSYTNLMAGYDPSWGKFKSISDPVPGNHEGGSPGNAGYYKYWGWRATPLEPLCTAYCKGYYSYNIGPWHVLALNTSTCNETTLLCGDFTAQAAWITADLKANPSECVLAYLHNPFWGFGKSATVAVKPLYQALINGGADLVAAGHAHNYERFKPQNINGQADPNGLTEIIVGTGGVNLMPVGSGVPNRAAAFAEFGVLKLVLGDGSWTSSFRSISGQVRDPSQGTCH